VDGAVTAVVAQGRPPRQGWPSAVERWWRPSWAGCRWCEARGAVTPFMSGVARRFFVSYSAPMITGALLTAALFGSDSMTSCPRSAALLRHAFVSSGAFSIPTIPVMGVGFMLLGCAALVAPLSVSNALLGVGFGAAYRVRFRDRKEVRWLRAQQ